MPLLLMAQRVKGRVVDSAGEPLAFVTVAALDGDSAVVAGATSTDDGSFTLDLPADALTLTVSYVGYESVVLPTESVKSWQFVLREETTHLNEVTINARQKLVERRMDKLVMNVAASPFAIGNNGKEILKKAPGVKIDRKGNITVNGKPVAVYINGRPTYLSGAQLKTLLEGTDGSTIDRLEIITQPSARYDAAGQGGIINIRTKRNLTRGINGSLSASYGGMYWRDLRAYMQEDHLSFTLNYRGSNTYTSASLSQQYSDKTEAFQSVIITPGSQRESFACTTARNQYYMLKLSNDWYIDTVNTLGFMFSTPLSYNNGHALPERNYSTLKDGGVVLERNTDDRTLRDQWLQHTANINYTHTFSKEKEQELSINLDYNRNNSRSVNHTLSRYELGHTDMPEVQQDNHHSTNIYSARLDFETQFWKTGKIECGAKWLTTKTGYQSCNDSLLSSFNYSEHIAALYTTMGKQFGEHWTAKLGLRGEYTRSIGHWLTVDSSSVRSYFNLFPTAYVGYLPTEDWSISVDYARRIQRPDYTMLDPSVQLEDAHSIRVGNTELMPAFTHNMLFSFGYSEYVSLDFDFSHTTGSIDYQTLILPGGDRISRAMNYGTNTNHGINLSLTEIPIVPKFTPRDSEGNRELAGAWLALTAQVGGMRSHYHSYDELIDMRTWAVDFYAELSAYLPHDWTLSLDGVYSTPFVWGTERLSEWKELNLAVKKEFPRRNLTITARVNDLLLSTQWGSEGLGLPEGCVNNFAGNDHAHMLTVGLVWKFGLAPEYRHRAPETVDTDRFSIGKKRK